MSKFQRVIAQIEKAGFFYIKSGEGVGTSEGSVTYHYQKNNKTANSFSTQTIQIALSKAANGRELLSLAFSNNISQNLRDEIYAITNSKEFASEPVSQFAI